ncbi:MAG: hypothetical protein MI747_21645, partial [Desulfobacterales bacterium]|nr:hypothetical protein [Desulfobacterales bacterium]
MKVAIVGGKLQGTEALYLSRKAGYETLLVDKRPAPPGRNLCHHFLQYDFTQGPGQMPPLPFVPDFILPALEDTAVLETVARWARSMDVPLAFDLEAFKLTTSKAKSDALFQRLGLPMPQPWPHCGFPAVVKPDSASGSQGVALIHSQADFDRQVTDDPGELIIQ